MPDRNASPEPSDSSTPREERVVAGIKIPPRGPEEIISETGFGAKLLPAIKDEEDGQPWEQTRAGLKESGAQTAPRRRWYRWAQELMMPDRKTPPESTDPPAGPKKMSIDGLELPPPGPAEIISESGFGTKLVRPTEDGQGDQVVRV